MSARLESPRKRIGGAVEELFGDSDSEWWVVVRAADKPRLLQRLPERQAELSPQPVAGDDDTQLLSSIVGVFGGRDSAPSDFEEWLKENDIEYEVSSYA